MKYIDFAENECLSTIVLGMMRISQMSEDEVEALVEAALSIGINTFDLADIYGDGQCEQLLGKVLKRRPDLRDQMWIQSKCGIRKDGFTYFDFSWGLTYFLKLHIIIVQGGQRRVSAKALKHNSVPECLVMQSFQ